AAHPRVRRRLRLRVGLHDPGPLVRGLGQARPRRGV
ncbi:MAG: hypothetical protein AVDCRST_MAG55-749, partial [uncultured Rubrobacteraceae bacterium]